MRDRGTDSPTLEKSQIGFLSNTGPDSLEIHKTINLTFNVGLRADDGSF